MSLAAVDLTLKEPLLALFTRYRVAEIEADSGRLLRDAFAVRDLADLVQRDGYAQYYALVKDVRATVDALLDRGGPTPTVINALLRLLYATRRTERYEEGEVLYRLIREGLYPNWSPTEQQIFDQKYRVVMSWSHYFLSYTERDANATNNSFNRLIKNLPRAEQKDRDKHNLLARLIARLLHQNNLRGFFDYVAIQSGDEIGAKVKEYCENCCAFVQLVEHETFAAPSAGRQNWSFQEYQWFKDAAALPIAKVPTPANRFHFVITTEAVDKLKPANLTPVYKDWYEHVAQLHATPIQGKGFEELRSDVQRMATIIVQLWDQMVEETLKN